MATLVDTLKAQGRATDYNSRKGLYESMGLNKQYGNYTGSYDQNVNFLKAISGGNPSPTAAQGLPSGAPVVQTAPPSGSATAPNPPQPTIPAVDTTRQAELQQQYLDLMAKAGQETETSKKYKELLANAPNQEALYNQYATELGVNTDQTIVNNLSKTVMDLEGKIGKIEPMINERAQQFVMTEAQRGRMVNAEQKPLRDQYLEAARQKNYAEVGLGAKKDLLNQRLNFTTTNYNNQMSLLKAMMGEEDTQRNTQLDLIKAMLGFENENVQRQTDAAEKEKQRQYELQKEQLSKSGTVNDSNWIVDALKVMRGEEPPTPKDIPTLDSIFGQPTSGATGSWDAPATKKTVTTVTKPTKSKVGGSYKSNLA